jgi:hypothetical protein
MDEVAMDDTAPSRTDAIVAAVVAMVGFAVAWGLVIWLANLGLFGSIDTSLGTSLYQRYGHYLLVGKVPYRGFDLEYPPLALPAFLLPSLATGGASDPGAYRAAFEWLMLGCGLATIPLVIFTIRRIAVRRRDLVVAASFLAASPLLLGPVMASRFDPWPALLTAAAMAAVLRDRFRIGAAFLALGILAKAYPVVLGPLLIAQAWRRGGRRGAVVSSLVAFVILAVALGPFLVVARAGTLDALRGAVGRPLQVESLGASLLLVLHAVAGLEVDMVRNFGSANLAGPLPDLLVVAQSAVLVFALGLVWIRFVRGPATPVRLVASVAASMCAYVALGKVFSPQYLIWLIPLVALLPGRRGLVAIAWLAATLVLTVAYFPTRYFDLVDRFDGLVAAVVFLRDVVLLGLAAYLARSADAPEAGRAPGPLPGGA